MQCFFRLIALEAIVFSAFCHFGDAAAGDGLPVRSVQPDPNEARAKATVSRGMNGAGIARQAVKT